MNEITREEFISYEEVRQSGITNMWNTTLVSELSNLSQEKIRQIITEHDTLMKKYPDVYGNTKPTIGIVNLKNFTNSDTAAASQQPPTASKKKPSGYYLNAQVRSMFTCTYCDKIISKCDICKKNYFDEEQEIECNDGTHMCKNCSDKNAEDQ